jgi:hypothetical protein
MLFTEAIWALCSFKELLLQRKGTWFVSNFRKLTITRVWKMYKRTGWIYQPLVQWWLLVTGMEKKITQKSGRWHIWISRCLDIFLSRPQQEAHLITKQREINVLPHVRFEYHLLKNNHARSNTSSPARSYKDSSSVACIKLVNIVRDEP